MTSRVYHCPVCHDPTNLPAMYCSDECRSTAKAWARRKGTKPCYVCRKWKRPTAFTFGSRICKKCRPPQKRPRRVLKKRKRCVHCDRTFQPHCNAQKFCRVKCREQESARDEEKDFQR